MRRTPLSSPDDSASDLDSIPTNIEDEDNVVKRVLVTGGAGFIGSHVATHLLKRGDIVIIVDEMNDYYDTRLKQANLDYLTTNFGDACTIYKGDICDVDFMADIFERERITHICHLAARAGVRPSIIDPYIYVHSNVEGTTRLLDLARVHCVKNFVYASSSSVYGCSQNEVLSECDAVEKPVSPYAATKKACELFAYTFHHLYGLNCTGLRFFTVYGPHGRPDMAPFKFIERVFHGMVIQQYGDGNTSRDYTYIDDIVDGVVAAIDKPLGCEVINLGNGRPFLLKDFISLVEKSVGRSAKIEILPHQPGDVDRTCADISKAQELLGYNPKVPFEEGIQRTAEWYRQATEAGLFDEDVKTTTTDNTTAERDNLNVSTDTATNNEENDDEVDDEQEERSRAGSIQTVQTVDSSDTPIYSNNRNTTTTTKIFGEVEKADFLSPLRAKKPSSTSSYNHKRHVFMHKISSDLELSSYVEKTPIQVKARLNRLL